MSIVIKAENISKQYRLGNIGTQTLRGDLQKWWYMIRGLPDPTLLIGQENILNTSHLINTVRTAEEYVWALKDINFEVQQGEVFGVIGKNGAGKSTLLKLLSRVTAPTTGEIKVKGRIASLLEVGTGFHPDLSGRENIFLNGAIMGMNKAEIRSKFDEIVDFAGVAMYIDTPVKRYSSGMFVRLAFAVAAHLDPEILIIDEVLAVGDSEFQRKALGKMQDVTTQEGRTVLFVSHNMSAINQLCTKGMILENGKIKLISNVEGIINDYLKVNNLVGRYQIKKENENSSPIFLHSAFFVSDRNVFTLNEKAFVEIEIHNGTLNTDFFLGLAITDRYEHRVMTESFHINNCNKRKIHILIELPIQILTPNIYNIDLGLTDHNNKGINVYLNCLNFEIQKENTFYENLTYDYGFIKNKFNWEIKDV